MNIFLSRLQPTTRRILQQFEIKWSYNVTYIKTKTISIVSSPSTKQLLSTSVSFTNLLHHIIEKRIRTYKTNHMTMTILSVKPTSKRKRTTGSLGMQYSTSLTLPRSDPTLTQPNPTHSTFRDTNLDWNGIEPESMPFYAQIRYVLERTDECRQRRFSHHMNNLESIL